MQETIGNNLGSLNNVLRVARTGSLTKAGECTLAHNCIVNGYVAVSFKDFMYMGVYVHVHGCVRACTWVGVLVCALVNASVW